MGKRDVVNHGDLHDTINYANLVKAQANEPTFVGTGNASVSVKKEPQGKTYTYKKETPYRGKRNR